MSNEIIAVKEDVQVGDVILEIGDRIKVLEAESKTAVCPDCGNKYLVQTGYCVTCKKKVGKKKKEDKSIKEGWDADILQGMSTMGSNPKNVVELIDLIDDAFSMWVDGSQENFSNEDAQEWGYRNIKDSIDAGKNALVSYFTETVNKIWR